LGEFGAEPRNTAKAATDRELRVEIDAHPASLRRVSRIPRSRPGGSDLANGFAANADRLSLAV
jgi:hypothetical protein